MFRFATCKVETFGFSEKADLRAADVEHVSRPGYLGMKYRVEGLMNFDVELTFRVSSVCYNSLTAIAVCRHFDVPVETIKKALKVAKVKGRIEMIKVSDDFALMIDYAHNAMSLESLLHTLRDYNPGRIVTVFGCGGNRSKTRRYEMGEVSQESFLILPSSLPIIRDLKNRRRSSRILLPVSRRRMENTLTSVTGKKLFAMPLSMDKKGDVIILAGKGHETYQEIKGVKYDMDDRVLIREVLDELKE